MRQRNEILLCKVSVPRASLTRSRGSPLFEGAFFEVDRMVFIRHFAVFFVHRREARRGVVGAAPYRVCANIAGGTLFSVGEHSICSRFKEFHLYNRRRVLAPRLTGGKA